jgi:thioredoxin-related protein
MFGMNHRWSPSRPSLALAAVLVLLMGADGGAAGADQDAAAAAEPDLTWLDHDAALAAAAEAGKPVLMHFTADWCKWCKVMQQETYTQAEVRTLMLDAFVTARVDTERQPRLQAAYGVQGLPTVWFLTSTGEPIIYIPGYVDGPTFLTVLKWIASGAHEHQSYEAFMGAGG